MSATLLEGVCIIRNHTELISNTETIYDQAVACLDEISDKLPGHIEIRHNMLSSLEEKGPIFIIFMSESERMNLFLSFVRKSLASMIAAVDGRVQFSEQTENTVKDICHNKVPITWQKRSYQSLKPLTLWIQDLGRRAVQLDLWAQDLSIPLVTWLPGLFEPQAFLAAIVQSAARNNSWKVEEVTISVEVTKKSPEDVSIHARDGAYVHGLFLEGARWDCNTSSLEDMKGRLLLSQLPVLLIKAVQRISSEGLDAYLCPVYKTQRRGGANIIFIAELPSLRHPVTRWALAGVAILAEVFSEDIAHL